MEPRRPSPRIVMSALFAVGIIVFSVMYTTREPTAEEILEATQSPVLAEIRSIQPDDHVYGNPNAPITFIVYTDFACPYCKEYHSIITGIIEQYGKEGSVALVYRNIPFVQIHPESPMYAHAAECVASIGGNETYWKYVSLFFRRYDSDNKPNADELTTLAEETGVSSSIFRDCMRSNKYMDRIETDYREATKVGATASPFTVVIEPDMRRSFEGTRLYVEIAAALLSSLQTFEETDATQTTNETESPYSLQQASASSTAVDMQDSSTTATTGTTIDEVPTLLP